LINSWATKAGAQVLLALLVVGMIGLLVRDLGNDPSAWDIVLRVVTAACWLTLLIAGQIGRRRQRRRHAEAGNNAPGPQVGVRAEAVP
jgi:hypothetical protein